MTKQLIIFVLSILVLSCSSEQNDQTENQEGLEEINLIDSSSIDISEESDLLEEPNGTLIIPNTRNQGVFNELSPFFLKNIELTECEPGYGEPSFDFDQKIKEIIWTDSTLSISFSFVATCGSDFLCDVEMVDFNSINLIYHQYNSYASCYCCYGLEFYFGIHEYYDPEFYGQLDDLPEMKYILFNGENRVKLE